MAIDPEKNNYEIPADVADAIKDLQPSVRAKIEEVFKAYDAFEDIDSLIYKLECFLRDKKICGEKCFLRDKKICGENGKYYIYDLTSKIRSIWEENNIYISELWNTTTCRVIIADLIEITINFKIVHYIDIMEDISVEYRGHNTKRFEITNSSELRKEAAQICKLLMNEL